MNDFDQAGRRAVKDDPTGQVRWVFPNMPSRWGWGRWLDSQSAPRPGEPDRRCDTIAELVDAEGREPPFAAVIELFTADDADAADRALEYRGRFRRELRHGPYGRDRYRFAMALVFFTEGPDSLELDETLPGEDSKHLWKPRLLCLARESAIATIQAIEENRLSLSIAVWLGLMIDGNTADFVTRWRRLVEQREPDELRRRSMTTLAVTFAELTGCQDVWIDGLKGFAMNESKLWRQIRHEGGAEARQEDVLRVLRLRYQDRVSPDLVKRVQSQTRLDELSRWLDLAITQPTVEDFVAALDR